MKTGIINFLKFLVKNKKQTIKTGVVKFFNKAKGFGFIKVDGEGELFVHSSGLMSSINENDYVQFEVQQGKKGLNAFNVQVVKLPITR